VLSGIGFEWAASARQQLLHRGTVLVVAQELDHAGIARLALQLEKAALGRRTGRLATPGGRVGVAPSLLALQKVLVEGSHSSPFTRS